MHVLYYINGQIISKSLAMNENHHMLTDYSFLSLTHKSLAALVKYSRHFIVGLSLACPHWTGL